MWRLVYGWATALVAGTLVLTAAVYVLQRSLVLTARGPRLAAGARTHLLAWRAFLLVLRGVGFWLDRFDLLFSPRGLVFGASYTDVHASLPVLAVAGRARGAVRGRLRLPDVPAGLALPGGRARGAGWCSGSSASASYPRCSSASGSRPTSWSPSGPTSQHNIRMTRQAYALDRVVEKEFAAEDNLTAAALERNSPRSRTSDCGTTGRCSHLRQAAGDPDLLQVPRRGRGPLHGQRRVPPGHAVGRASSPTATCRAGGLDQRAPDLHPRLRARGGAGQPRSAPRGCPSSFVKDIPPVGDGAPRITRPEIYYGEIGNEYVFVRTRSQELDYPSRRPERLHAVRGPGRHPGQLVLRQARLRGALRRAQDAPVRRPHAGEPRDDLPRHRAARASRPPRFSGTTATPTWSSADDGRLVWMLDGYTTTDRYPYAEPVRGIGNYIRNSVKATVDAYDGTVDLLRRRRRGPDHPHLRQGVPGHAPAARRDAQGPAGAHPLPRGSLHGAGADVRHLPHGGSAGLLQQGGPVGRPAAAPGRPRQGDGARTSRSCACPASPRRSSSCSRRFNPSGRDNMIALLAARSDAPNYGRLIVLQLPQAEAGLRAAQHRRADQPGPGDLAADLAVEPAGLARARAARCSPSPSRSR